MKKAICVLLALMLLLCGASQQPFRLNVVADDVSEQDEELKLKVRDAILDYVSEEMSSVSNASEASEYVKQHLDELTEAAKDVVEDQGFDYEVSLSVGTFAFPTRTYEDVTYTAGDYEGLKVILGDGEGTNWWCVLFPPMCVSEADESTKVTYVSFFAELFNKIFGRNK